MYSDVVKGAEVTSEREKLAWLLAAFGIGLGLACGIGWYGATGKVRTVEKVVEIPAPVNYSSNSNALAFAPKVGVCIALGDECKSLADAGDLKTSVELKLRSNGIIVNDGIGEDSGLLTIEIVPLWNPDKTILSYSCIAQFKDGVTRARQGQVQFLANVVTWHDVRTGMVGAFKAKDALERTISVVGDAFANAYLAANPKP